MSDTIAEGRRGPFQRDHHRRRGHRPINLEGVPTVAELAAQTPEQREKFPLYTPGQVKHHTRAVRLEISFPDPIHIRDQAKMITSVMRLLDSVSRQHKLGKVYQCIVARAEVAACARALNILNGKQKAK